MSACTTRKPDSTIYLSPTIAAVANKVARGESTEIFWQQIIAAGTPLVEPFDDHRKVMTFLVRGAQKSVLLIGAPANDHQYLERLGQSDIWYKSFVVPNSARLTYKIAVDVPDLSEAEGGRWRALMLTAKADPLNHTPWPKNSPDFYVQESSISLPDAPPQPWSEQRQSPVGELKAYQVESKILGNSRAINLYTSPGFSPSAPNAILLFVFDAREFISLVPTPIILDNLYAAGRLPPIAAVFVGNPDSSSRSHELPDNPEFARFMAQELYPWASRQLGVRIPAERTALAGSSFGGLAAVTVAMRHTDVFGNALALSGSFWWKGGADLPVVPQRVISQPRLPLHLFVSAGLFEGSRNGEPGIIDTSRQLRDALANKGYEFHYREYVSGHDYFAWQGALADGLLALFEAKR
ncbi:MAG: alpha/beta hydrolase-fold protein [Cellvibrio sp.]|uniref:alpha/beta hydrolase-fold protein n=1 Tax=Cellvibrio sp. TaxID=1965322 RepID=UPI0031AC4BF7